MYLRFKNNMHCVHTIAFKTQLRFVGFVSLIPLLDIVYIPPLHDWYNKGRDMCYSVCGMVHKKEPLLLIEKSSPRSGGSGFPLSLSKLSFTICPTPYNRK